MTLVAAKKPHHSHRKRSGLHQHGHKNFGKTYWPYLPLLLVVGLGFLVNSLWPSHRDVLGYATDMSQSALLGGTNQQRANDKQRPLHLNNQLSSAAQQKANDMASKDYWSHNSPSGQTPWSFITASHYSYKTAGENLAYGFDTSGATITGWMNSPEHKANILNTSYTDVGFGIVNIPNYQGNGPETLVVALYASPATATAVNTSNLKQSQPITSEGGSTTPQTTTHGDTVTPRVMGQTSAEQSTTSIARIQLVSNGEASWSLMALLVIMTVSFVVLLVRHGYAWHKLLNRGERFVLKHPVLDVVTVGSLALAVVLSQTAGFIK